MAGYVDWDCNKLLYWDWRYYPWDYFQCSVWSRFSKCNFQEDATNSISCYLPLFIKSEVYCNLING